jgi:putative aminopeptidase FrvX
MSSTTLIADIEFYSGLFGPSGHEDAVIRAFADAVQALGYPASIDALGNVTVPVREPDAGYPSFAVTAHLDEIGFVVRDIDPAGWLYLDRIGGVNDRVVAGQLLRVLSDSGELVEGHVGVKGAHVSSEAELATVVTVEKAYVDLLLSSREEVLGQGIRIGSPAAFAGPFSHRGALVRGKAFDDRIGIAAMLELVRRLQDVDFGAGLTLIATVQEEFSMRAGVPPVRAVHPDVLMCLDIGLAADSPDHNTGGPPLGAGPVIHGYTRGRTGGGLIPNPVLVRYVAEVAAKHEVPYVHATLRGGLTDGSYMQYAGAGIATIDLAFPVRNAHTAVEVAHLSDVDHLVDLVAHTITDAGRGQSFARG